LPENYCRAYVLAKAMQIGNAMHRSRSHDAVIPVYDDAGNVIETHEHAGGVNAAVWAIAQRLTGAGR
jgi:hypothetical protein